jgi:hypothetical protein
MVTPKVVVPKAPKRPYQKRHRIQMLLDPDTPACNTRSKRKSSTAPNDSGVELNVLDPRPIATLTADHNRPITFAYDWTQIPAQHGVSSTAPTINDDDEQRIMKIFFKLALQKLTCAVCNTMVKHDYRVCDKCAQSVCITCYRKIVEDEGAACPKCYMHYEWNAIKVQQLVDDQETGIPTGARLMLGWITDESNESCPFAGCVVRPMRESAFTEHLAKCPYRTFNCPILYCESKTCDTSILNRARLHPAAHHNRIALKFMNAHLRAKLRLIPLTYVHVSSMHYPLSQRSTYFVHNVSLSWRADHGTCEENHCEAALAPRTPLSVRSWSWIVNVTMETRDTNDSNDPNDTGNRYIVFNATIEQGKFMLAMTENVHEQYNGKYVAFVRMRSCRDYAGADYLANDQIIRSISMRDGKSPSFADYLAPAPCRNQLSFKERNVLEMCARDKIEPDHAANCPNHLTRFVHCAELDMFPDEHLDVLQFDLDIQIAESNTMDVYVWPGFTSTEALHNKNTSVKLAIHSQQEDNDPIPIQEKRYFVPAVTHWRKWL